MSKYNYDKSVLKGLGVGAFLGQEKKRVKIIEETKPQEIIADYNANKLAASLHPDKQYAVISDIIDVGVGKVFTLKADPSKGTKKLAYFRAGNCISIYFNIGSSYAQRPYTICSAPSQTLDENNSIYQIIVKRVKNGYASDYILDNWKVGDSIEMSGPKGVFNYEPARDAKHVIAVAGGSGITPFISMAQAIVDGDEDFKLTILFGNRTESMILAREAMEELAQKSNGKVKIVHVLSEEEKPGYEHGFITAELIKKYGGNEDFSVFASGPVPMYRFMEKELKKLKFDEKRYRVEVGADLNDGTVFEEFPQENKDKTFNLTVNIRDEKRTIPCKASEPIIVAIERAGIKIPSNCRAGLCGWCHSLVNSGEYFIAPNQDGRRMADKKFNWIHPCATYAKSDMEISVYPEM